MRVPTKQDVERLMRMIDNNKYLSSPAQAFSLRKEAEQAERDLAIAERFGHDSVQD